MFGYSFILKNLFKLKTSFIIFYILLSKSNTIMRTLVRNLGMRVKFPDTTVSGLLKNKAKIVELIDQNGCICLQNINFNANQMVEFTQGIWDEVIALPKELAFNNQDPNLKYITRVGNILLDGTIKDSAKQAAYWHQDGNFWGEDKKHLFNCLHTRETPTRGGDTWVLDLVQGAHFMKTQKPQIWKKMQQLVGELNLAQINDFKLFGHIEMGIQKVTRHALIKPFGKWGFDQVLFLSIKKLIDKKTGEYFTEFDPAFLQDILEKEMGFYAHKWRDGDMVIWDNLQTMHRASGDFEGRRLLFRTQGRNKKQ